MNAVVFDKTLRVARDHPDPTPGPGEALIRVLRAGICATDLEITRGYMGFRGILGHEFVGEVIQGTARWRGRRVVGEINCVCHQCDMCAAGLSTHCRRRTVMGIVGRDGAFAQLVCLPEANLHEVPEGVSDDAAVFAEPLAAACQVLVHRPLTPDMSVAVIGSGRLGLLVAQVLRHTGCDLTVAGRNPLTLGLCAGWDIATAPAGERRGQRRCDVVVECSGTAAGFVEACEWVRPRGTVVLKSTYAGSPPDSLAPVVIDELTIVGSRCGPFAEALRLLAAGRVEVEGLISAVLPLDCGVDAFGRAASRDVIKVLLDPVT